MADSHQVLPPDQVLPPAAAILNEKGANMERSRSRPVADQDSISDSSSYDSAQAGVKRIEATSTTWTKWSLLCAYAGYVCTISQSSRLNSRNHSSVLTEYISIVLVSYATSLEGQTTVNLSIFATSAFSAHSLISTVTVIQGVILCMSLSTDRNETSLTSLQLW